MAGWLELVLIAGAVMVALWGLLVILAARLPPGLPACITLAAGCGPTLGCPGRPRPPSSWPGEPRLLERLLGTPASAKPPAEPESP